MGHRGTRELREAVGTPFLLVCGAVYFAQGFRSIASLSLQAHLKAMGLTAAMSQSVMTTAALPWSVKPLYGLVSDFVPIGGRRRQPYILLAGAVGVAAWTLLAGITQGAADGDEGNTSRTPGGQGTEGDAPAPAVAPVVLTAVMLLSNLSTAVSDVVVDAMVAEKAGEGTRDGLEDDLQDFCWNAMFVGGALGSAVGAVAMTTLGAPGVFLATAVCPLIVATAALALDESPRVLPQGDSGPQDATVGAAGLTANPPDTAAGQLRATVAAACDPAVLIPLLYIFIDGAAHPGLGTVTYLFVTTELGFSNEYLSAMGSVMWGMMLVGSLLGSSIFTPGKSSYREFMWWGGIVRIVTSLSTLLLVLRVNVALGISDEVYVGVSDAVETAISRVLMLPFLSLAAKLTALHPGCEATLFALFMSVSNLSSATSAYFGAALCVVLGLEDGSFEALPHALAFRTACMALPLALTYRMVPVHPPSRAGPANAAKVKDE